MDAFGDNAKQGPLGVLALERLFFVDVLSKIEKFFILLDSWNNELMTPKIYFLEGIGH